MFFIRLLMLLFAAVTVNCYAVTVGDSIGGGTAFCVSQTADTSSCVTTTGASGLYALIMANEDQANSVINSPNTGITWSSAYSTTGASSLINGATNTAAILTAFPSGTSSNNAAKACSIYNGGGYNDWYLPSLNELQQMYLYASAHSLIGSGCTGATGGMQCLVGSGNSNNNRYWSSTEFLGNSDFAWGQDFGNGGQGSNH